MVFFVIFTRPKHCLYYRYSAVLCFLGA